MKKRVVAIILALAVMLNGNIVMAAEVQRSVNEETVVENIEEQGILDQSEQILEEDATPSEAMDDIGENADNTGMDKEETEIENEAEADSVSAEKETESEILKEETNNSLSEEIETGNLELETNEVLESTAQAVDTSVPDYNIWMANTLLYGYQNDENSSLYQMFQDFYDPVYKELGGYLLEDEPLVNMSAAWSALLNEEYRGQLTEKYIYEILLTDYLMYDANSISTTIDLDNEELDFSMQMYSLLVKELNNNTYDYIKNLTVEKAINFYDNVGTALDLDFALQEVKKYKDKLKDVQEVINLISECLALQQAQEERILLLKEARNACAALDSPNTEFIAAADDLISAMEGSPIEYVVGRSTSYILKQSINSVWEILCNGNLTLQVVSDSIELGVSGMDALFDTTNSASNNLKLALLYTLDSYMKLGMMNATADFMSSNTQENAKTYIGCFQAYVQFQMCGNDYSIGWLEECIDDKSLSGLIKQIFLRDNISTGKELIARVESQNVNRTNLLQLMSKYAEIYRNLYSKEGWEEFIGQISVTGISFSQSEMTLSNPDSDIYVAYAEVTPANATNKNVIYTSSNPEILSVPESGGFGSIKGTGTVVITATAEDGGFTTTQTVHVGSSSGEEDKQKCGENVYWEYSNNTLHIYGNGRMTDFEKPEDAPWYKHRTGIYYLNIENGVENIGSYAFGASDIRYSYKNLGSDYIAKPIVIPDSVTEIGKGAFAMCYRFCKIKFSQNLQKIDDSAFTGANFFNLELPESLTYIGAYAFSAALSGSTNYHQEQILDLSKVKVIKKGAFSSCRNLLYVIVSADTKIEDNIGCAITIKKDEALSLPKTNLTKVQTWGYNQLKVSWDSANGADGYRIYYATSVKGTFKYLAQINGGSTASYYHKGLTTGKTYYYKVRAYQKVNGKYVFGEYSDVISAKPLPKTVNVTKAESFGCNTKLTWDKVNGANGYRLYYYTPESFKYQYITQITSGSTTSYIHSNLKAGQTYYYKIRAYRTVNGVKVFGGYSAVKKVTPSLTGMKLTKAQTWGYNQVRITWEPVIGAQGYRIYYATSKNGSYKYVTQVSGSNTGSYIHKKLTTGKTYYYKVRAYQKFNGKYIFGEYASPVSAKPIPKQVKISTVTASGTNAVKLTWGTVTGASGYRIYYRETGAQEWKYVTQIGKGNTLTYIHKELAAGKSYEYKMRAYRTVNGSKVFGAFSVVKSVSLGDCKDNFLIENGYLYDYTGNSENVVIPSGVKVISDGAFFDNKTIKSVVIPEGVTEIGWNAFLACTNLTSVTFPDSVETIVTGAFDDTAWLDIQREKNPLVIVNDILLDGKTASGDVTIPYGIKTIGYYAFCPDGYYIKESNITSVSLPESVERIEMFAFYGCDKLKTITIPDKVTVLPAGVFGNCRTIESVIIPYMVTDIERDAFLNCTSLKNIEIPEGMRKIGETAFEGCTNITFYGKKGSYAQAYAKEYNIPFHIM